MYKDLILLTKQLASLILDKGVLRESPHFVHDLLFGANVGRKEFSSFYMDLHVHLPKTASARNIVYSASRNVDLMAITDRNPEDQSVPYLTFDTFVEKLEQERMNFEVMGHDMIRTESLMVVRGYENYVSENQGVVSIGSKRSISKYSMTMDEAVKSMEGDFWFLDHMHSVWAPKIGFRYPTVSEMDLRREWIERYDPIVEVGNHQNTLWMFPSNVLTRRMASHYGLGTLANSDTHFDVSEIGLSKTVVPRVLLNEKNQDTFLASLHEAFRDVRKSIKVESNYASIYSFGKNMVLPTLVGRG